MECRRSHRDWAERRLQDRTRSRQNHELRDSHLSQRATSCLISASSVPVRELSE